MRILKLVALLYIFLNLSSDPVHANVAWEKVNLPKLYITSIQNTHYGVVAGEFDSRAFLNPVNGISITKDFGDTWQDLGLAKRGVTDIYYQREDRSIYAATYYSVFDSTKGHNTLGLYVSYDVGKTWQHMGPEVSASKVLAFDNTILLGTYSHGLWFSDDNGATWNQKLGSGYFGPRIKMLKLVGNAIYAYDDAKTYVSLDQGLNWQVFQPLGDEKIADIEGTSEIIFAGTSNGKGMFYSKDGGTSWTKDSFWLEKSVHSIKYFPLTKTFYLGTSIGVWFSSDNGKTWNSTYAPFSKQTLGIAWVFSENSKLFATVQQEGVYKYNIPSPINDVKPYFAFPWKQTYPNETLDSISAFFDHAYPLLGYDVYPEPSTYASTTTNFYGLSLPIPELYYSSHDGTDFAVKYGTEVLAVQSGSASYGYEKYGLGYFIKVTHVNGYQTIYGHLQPHQEKPPTQIAQGDTIGKVGMSGNTSGPHLHFTVVQDVNADGDFTNDTPHGKTDPFGWQSILLPDPWNGYQWQDELGIHTACANIYLWQDPLYTKRIYLDGKANQTIFLDIKIQFRESQQVYTALITPLPTKRVNIGGSKVPLANTFFELTVLDTFGNEVVNANNFDIEIYYDDLALLNINEESLEVLRRDNVNNDWVPVSSDIDKAANTVRITTQSGLIVLTGLPTDTLPPITKIKIHGKKSNATYVEMPVIELTAEDTDYQSTVQTILYKINDGEFLEYAEPFLLPLGYTTTTYTLQYRSLDAHQNLEEINSLQIAVDVSSIRNKKIKLKDVGFETSQVTN